MSSGSNPPPFDAVAGRGASLVRFALAALVAAAAPACRDRAPTRARAGDAGPAAASIVARVLVDGAVVAELTAADVDRRPALVDLVPPAAREVRRWQKIEARAPAPHYQFLALPKPARNFPGQVARIFRDRKGQVAFGMERGGDRPYFTTMRSGIQVVAIHTREAEQPAGAPPPAPPDLRVVVGEEEKPIAASRLEGLARVDADREADGWRLGDVLALATPAERIARVTVIAGGQSIEVDGAKLVDPQVLAVVKLTRRGDYRFKMWKLGPKGERELAAEARLVERLVVTPRR
jgi:hypothetical protein